jgi:L-arabonate dehydrase
VLHVSPEAAIGGLLAIVQSGDMISLDTHQRTLNLDITEKEISLRLKNWTAGFSQATRGYVSLYQSHVEQAHLGADLDFLKGGSGSRVTRDSH